MCEVVHCVRAQLIQAEAEHQPRRTVDLDKPALVIDYHHRHGPSLEDRLQPPMVAMRTNLPPLRPPRRCAEHCPSQPWFQSIPTA